MIRRDTEMQKDEDDEGMSFDEGAGDNREKSNKDGVAPKKENVIKQLRQTLTELTEEKKQTEDQVSELKAQNQKL